MFLNLWDLILWRKSGKKQSSCSDDYKYVSLILVQSEQQFKIQSHFGIFDPVIGEGQLYDDAESYVLKSICELFGNISFLYRMKSILYICKNLVDAEFIYNLLSFFTCDFLH